MCKTSLGYRRFAYKAILTEKCGEVYLRKNITKTAAFPFFYALSDAAADVFCSSFAWRRLAGIIGMLIIFLRFKAVWNRR